MEQFWLIRNQQRSGPFSEQDILLAHRQGTLRPDDMLWSEGVGRPVSVAEVFSNLPAPARAASDELVLLPIDDRRAGAAASPYQPPRASVEDIAEDQGDMEYAGFWVRYAAAMLDTLVACILVAPVALLFAAAGRSPMSGGTDIAYSIVATIVSWLYLGLGESGQHCATPGKRAFGLQVLGADFGDRISFARASGRFAARYLSLLLLLIGYLMQPFTRRKQALHDLLAATVVIVQRPYSRLLVGLMIALGLLGPILVVAAVALPAYQTSAVRARVAVAIEEVKPALVAVQNYMNRTGEAPRSLEETGFDPRRPLPGIRRVDFDPGTGIVNVTLDFTPVEGRTVQIVPVGMGTGTIAWGCFPGTLPPSYLPRHCGSGE